MRTFGELVHETQNTGHLLIDAGFRGIGLPLSGNVVNFWDTKIGTDDCSCKKQGMVKEILLASSLISHDISITGSSDFRSIDNTLDHLITNHNLRAVIGLGINGIKHEKVAFEKLSKVKQNFLNHLIINRIAVGSRGLETQSFLENVGFDPEYLYLTGCPSLQLVQKAEYVFPDKFSSLLISGALIERLDLIESMTTSSTKLLFIPQTMDNYHQGLELQRIDNRIEVFPPLSIESWMDKIRTFHPELALGTRLHGNIAAASLGIPSILMSGDIRTREITYLGNLPFIDDLAEIQSAVGQVGSQIKEISLRSSVNLAANIRACLHEFI